MVKGRKESTHRFLFELVEDMEDRHSDKVFLCALIFDKLVLT